jgi:hypothetical protein
MAVSSIKNSSSLTVLFIFFLKFTATCAVQGIREQCVLHKDTFSGGGSADGQAGHSALELGSCQKAQQWL